MKILLLSRYERRGASSRVRSYQYIPYLKSKGLEVTAYPFFDDHYLDKIYESQSKLSVFTVLRFYLARIKQVFSGKKYDLIWFEKEIFPWLPDIFERLIKITGRPYLGDYDDAIFHRYDQHPNFLVRLALGNKIDKIMNRAAVVTVGNSYLERKALNAGAVRVELVPSVVDLDRYSLKDYNKGERLRIVWIGTPVTIKYIDKLMPVFHELKRIIDFQLVLIGVKEFNCCGLEVEVIPWSEDSEAESIRSCDIGIMPLENDLFEQGKCGYKLIQYMASGLPVIASPVGVNKVLVAEGINGYLAESQSEWLKAFEKIASDFEESEKMGRAGRRMVEQNYCLQVTAPRLAEIMKSIIG